MKKSVKSMMAIALIAIGIILLGQTAYAETLDGLKGKRSDVKDERAEVKEDLDKANAEVADVLFDLKEINEEIALVEDALKKNKNEVKDAEEAIETSEEEVVVLQDEITGLENDIDIRNDILKQRLASIQKSGGSIGYLDVLLGSKSFADFIGRASAMTKVADSDVDLINQQEEDKELIVQKFEKVESKLIEQEEHKVELKGMQQLIADQQKENKKKKKTLKETEKEIKTLKDDLENEDSSLASLEAEIKSDIATARTPVQVASSSSNSEDESSKESSQENLNQLGASNSSKGSGGVDVAINSGYNHLGLPYVFSGKNPSTGFDCSGFVSWAYSEAGQEIPSSTNALSSTGQKVSPSDMQRGDLVFFDTYKKDGHVGIYIGNGEFLGAQTSQGVSEADMNSNYWSGKFEGHVRRVN